MDKKVRNGKIDFFKFVFSLVVIVFHFSNTTKYPNKIFTNGYVAVEFFFIVSGFLFANSLSKIPYNKDTFMKDCILFIGKKFKSFMPYHLFVCVPVLAVAVIRNRWNIYQFIENFIYTSPDIFFLGMGGVHKTNLLKYEWYISAMLIAMFILTPIFIKYKKAFMFYIAPVLSVLLMGFLYNTYKNIDIVYDWNGFCYSGLLRGIAEISIGCICFAVYQSGVLEKFSRPLLICTEIAAYSVFIIYANTHTRNKDLEFPLVAVIALGITISFMKKSSFNFMNNRFVYFLGKFSFPLYLTQMYLKQPIEKMQWDYGYWSHLGFYLILLFIFTFLCIIVSDNIVKIIHRKTLQKKSTESTSAD